MRFWFDFEFIDDGNTIDPISIGIVSESGRGLYEEFAEASYDRAGDWVKENVWPRLLGETSPREKIAEEIRQFVGQDPEFWAWFGAYDWVALNQLCWGPLVSKRNGWPHRYEELAQLADACGITRETIIPKPAAQHHALTDAVWAKQVWQQCMDRKVAA